MAKIYVITDKAIGVDSFVFLQPHDGAAMSYFYNWCLMQNHRDFELSSIGAVGYLEEASHEYLITHANRTLVCVMPTEEQENAREKELRDRKITG